MRLAKRLIIISVAIFISAFALINFLHSIYVPPILMYHSVSPDAEPENRIAVSVDLFERQMHFLKARHYNVIPLESLAALIKDRRKIPPKTIAITFDDGYKNVYTHAFPILKKYNLAATIFLIVNEIGRPQRDRLEWSEIEEMLSSGLISVGSHCVGPEPLVNLKSEKEVKYQIFESKKMLEEHLGCKVNAFSHPEGLFTEKIVAMVKDAGYKMAVATNPGKKSPKDDIFRLKRLRISATSNNLAVFWLQASGYYTFIKENRKK